MIDLLFSKADIREIVIYVLSAVFVVFITMPIHEFAHAFAANALGDNTPKYQGRLTLNPIAHIDPIGAVLIALFGFGWAKPVQVNLNNFKRPKLCMAIVAIAGPLANLICALVLLLLGNTVATVAIYSDIDSESAIQFITYILIFFRTAAAINVSLAVFNLIPVPPLDGSKILNAILPFKIYYKILQYERYIMFVLMAILFFGVLDVPLSWLGEKALDGVLWLANLPFGFLY